MKLVINPDEFTRNELLEAVRKNDGYCPCKLREEDNKCMCKDARENDECICGLYLVDKGAR